MIRLPWPPSVLSPNDRSHWAKKSKVRAKYRSDCYYITKSFPIPAFADGNIPLTIIFYPPSKRGFDADNLHARLKGGLDGVADAWGINDRRFLPITIDFGNVEKGGCVEIYISENK